MPIPSKMQPIRLQNQEKPQLVSVKQVAQSLKLSIATVTKNVWQR